MPANTVTIHESKTGYLVLTVQRYGHQWQREFNRTGDEQQMIAAIQSARAGDDFAARPDNAIAAGTFIPVDDDARVDPDIIMAELQNEIATGNTVAGEREREAE